jgi:nitronate monooxygenase
MSTAPFSTPLSRRLGLRYPIVAAPMFLISGRELIVAAAEAGIVGAMPSLNARTAADLKADLEWIRARTDKPFAINVTIGLTAPERLEQDVQLLMDFEVPIIITSYGDPTTVVKRAHDKGLFVMHDVIHLKHAQKARAAGVDAIIGVSAGAGGHAGRISPYALIPWLKENLDVPIVAAGCISTGKQMAASFALGAELCYLGTRFIASTECRAVDAYKQMVVDAGPDDIVYTDAVSGIHANFLKATIPEATEASRGPDAAKRWKDIWSAGQGVVDVKDIKPVGQIVEDLVREYHDAKASLP